MTLKARPKTTTNLALHFRVCPIPLAADNSSPSRRRTIECWLRRTNPRVSSRSNPPLAVVLLDPAIAQASASENRLPIAAGLLWVRSPTDSGATFPGQHFAGAIIGPKISNSSLDFCAALKSAALSAQYGLRTSALVHIISRAPSASFRRAGVASPMRRFIPRNGEGCSMSARGSARVLIVGSTLSEPPYPGAASSARRIRTGSVEESGRGGD